VFLTLEDESGMLNLIVWPKTWQANRKLARNASMLGVDGRLQRQDDAVSVLVDRFWELPAPPPDGDRADPAALASLPVRSRDFH
jgi:error-prone DNA polymerase